jgi:hypothetical protein
MTESNLFTMLSAFHPGSPATPFETYCTNGLGYFLKNGHRMLTALFAGAAGIYGEPVALVEVQPRLAGAGIADLLITFEGGRPGGSPGGTGRRRKRAAWVRRSGREMA